MFLTFFKKIVLVALCANLLYGLNVNTNLDMRFWYDNVPPTKNDKHFFKKVSKAIKVLQSNNRILEDEARKNGISTVDKSYARELLKQRVAHFGVEDNFFYDLEKAQLILSIKMLTNHCKVTSSCTSNMAKQGIDQLIKHAIKTTKRGRDLKRRRDIENRNNLIMASIVGAVVVNTISNIVNSSNNYTSYSTDIDQASSSTQKIDKVLSSTKRVDKNLIGLKNIRDNGKIGGNPSFLLTCNTGSTTVLKRVNGSWHTGFLGDMGHKFDYWSKHKVGEYICTH